MRQIKKLTEVLSLMQRKENSGLSVKAFCEAQRIPPATYYYWRKRLQERQGKESSAFIPVHIERDDQEEFSRNVSLELTYPNGVRIKLPEECPLSFIRALVHLS